MSDSAEAPNFINTAEVRRHEKRTERFGWWLASSMLSGAVLMIAFPIFGLVFNMLACVAAFFWGLHLMKKAPYVGEGPGWDEEEEPTEEEDPWEAGRYTWGKGDWADYAPRRVSTWF